MEERKIEAALIIRQVFSVHLQILNERNSVVSKSVTTAPVVFMFA